MLQILKQLNNSKVGYRNISIRWKSKIDTWLYAVAAYLLKKRIKEVFYSLLFLIDFFIFTNVAANLMLN